MTRLFYRLFLKGSEVPSPKQKRLEEFKDVFDEVMSVALKTRILIDESRYINDTSRRDKILGIDGNSIKPPDPGIVLLKRLISEKKKYSLITYASELDFNVPKGLADIHIGFTPNPNYEDESRRDREQIGEIRESARIRIMTYEQKKLKKLEEVVGPQTCFQCHGSGSYTKNLYTHERPLETVTCEGCMGSGQISSEEHKSIMRPYILSDCSILRDTICRERDEQIHRLKKPIKSYKLFVRVVDEESQGQNTRSS